MSQPTVGDLLLARADDHNPGYLFEDTSYTWAEVVDESLRRAAVLQDRFDPSIPRHVGVLLDNSPEYLFWIGGAALINATVVGINPTRRGADLARDIAHTDCQFIVSEPNYFELLAEVPTDVPVLDIHEMTLPTALASHKLPPPDPSSMLYLLFTSGSTSAPKAVPCTNGRAAGAGQRLGAAQGHTADDVHYCPMPLFHGNALLACWGPALAFGASVVLRRKFSASEFINDVRRHGCTYFTYVGRTISYVLSQPPQPDDADNRLRLAFGTEAPARDREEFQRRFGCTLVEGYGSSESAIVITRTPDTPPKALGRMRPDRGDDIACVDEHGNQCPTAELGPDGELLNPDAIGEFVNRAGGSVFEGYYNNPEATSKRLRNGWFWSGDLGYQDADGFFYFAGRTDDWMRVDSENLAAGPIAELLQRYGPATGAVVFGVPDEVTGDQVMAVIEMPDPSLFDPVHFVEFLEAQPDLGTKWAPRYIRVVSQIPTTANNKVHVPALRAEGITSADTWRTSPRSLRYERCE